MSPKKLTYHHRIIVTLLLLSVVFYIPYTIVMYAVATSKIKETIISSNEEHLNQIYRDFEKSKEAMSRQVYSLYIGTTMQSLLYGSESSFDAISELQTINSNVVSLDRSIYSVAMYNASLNEFHSTMPTPRDDSLSFVSQQNSPPKLTPIFRKLNTPYSKDSDMYLFSYIMYEYRMTQGNPSSFVIINQDVEYLLDELQKSDYAESTSADFFLLSKEFGACGSVKNIAEEDIDRFTQAFCSSKDQSVGSGSLTLNIEGKNFFVSYITLPKTDVDVVIIQPKNIVFSTLTDWHIYFFILLGIGLILYLVIVYFQAKALYRPVEILGDHIRELDGAGSFTKETNEFEQFKAVYSSFTTMKQKYYLRYMEDQLLTNSSESVVSGFSASFPNHWLLKCPSLLVAQIIAEFPNASVSSQERELDLYAVRNIAEELLSENFKLEMLQIDNNHLAAILGSDGNWASLYAKFGKVKKSIDHFFDFSISVYCSDPVTQLDELGAAYSATCVLESYAPIFGRKKILSPDAIQENLNNTAISYPQSLLNELTAALKNRNSEKIHAALQDLCIETKKLSIQNLWFCISLLINHIRNILCEISTAQQSVFMKQLTQLMSEFTTVDLFFSKLETLVIATACTGTPVMEASDKNALFLQHITKYVAEHYQDSQLSPTQIAEQFDVSANYLPRKFQLLSGVSLNSYILQVRMEQAAALLLNQNLPIAEIANLVGIENESYFYKLFKKYYGCTPKEYKSRKAI